MAKTSAKDERPGGVVIMAAGLGTRMKSSLPKALNPIGGRPLLFHILERVREALPGVPVAVVVGHGADEVRAAVDASGEFRDLDLTYVLQPSRDGTGHAVQCAVQSPWGEAAIRTGRPVMVLPGDQPLISRELVAQLGEPLARGAAMRLVTCEVENPTGYGRVVRRGKRGAVLRIAEEKDANAREKAIREIATSLYLFGGAFLKAGLHRLSPRNALKEYYLTDVVAQAARARKGIDVLPWGDPDDVKGINTLWELAEAAQIMNLRCVRRWSAAGVRFVNPWTTFVDSRAKLAPDVVIEPGVMLYGACEIGAGTVIGARAILTNVKVGEKALIRPGCVADDSTIESGAKVGPYAHLRPGSIVRQGAKIGNFVELKNSTIGRETSVAHLSYVGDAEVGSRVNIGCGFVTCNYDGRVIDGNRKHRTVIEDDVFVGSDCQTVAPVRLGRGSYIASGSTITEDVEPDALAIARSRQVSKPGYAKKLRQPGGS